MQVRREPPPFPLAGITVDDLRKAKSGRVVYDGCGLSGTGEYESIAVLNGVVLGNMTPAGGDEVHGVFVQVGVPLTPEAIAKLSMHNKFSIRDTGRDSFKIRRFWIELTLADGRKVSTDIAAATYSQPGEWLYAEGIGVPFEQEIAVDLYFGR